MITRTQVEDLQDTVTAAMRMLHDTARAFVPTPTIENGKPKYPAMPPGHVEVIELAEIAGSLATLQARLGVVEVMAEPTQPGDPNARMR